MAEFDRLFRINKTNIALHQIERAILLFLNEKDFICAITLSGAAEEILGTHAKNSGKEPCVESQAKLLKNTTLPELKEEEIIHSHLNLARNALKHSRKHPNDTKEENMSLALETEAIALIVRALDNMAKLGIEYSKPMNDFVFWAHTHRQDIASHQHGAP